MDTLYQLNVRENTLTQAEKDFLAKNGYLNLGQLLSDVEVERINNRINALMDAEGDNAGSELLDSPYIRHPKEAGADRLADQRPVAVRARGDQGRGDGRRDRGGAHQPHDPAVPR